MRQTLSRFRGPVYVVSMTADKPGEIKPTIPAKSLIPFEHRVERAAGDFRRGAPVLIQGMEGENGLAAAAEMVDDPTLEQLVSRYGAPSLILTHARASTLKIRLYTADVVSIPLSPHSRAADIRAIADPATDLDHPLKGPFEAARGLLPASAAAATRLAKLAGLLPAAVLFPIFGQDLGEALLLQDGLSAVSISDIARFEDSAAQTLALVVRALVPLEGAEDAELVAFRPANGGQEHYAILIGSKGAAQLAPPGPVLTRLHSECFTGDLLGSLKCDCGDQLRGAVQAIAKAGGGVLLYLAQEGRGIGLMNKLRAYALQDQGLDTVEANERLGFKADQRDYGMGVQILRELGIRSMRLLSNNPRKLVGIEGYGLSVSEWLPLEIPASDSTRRYLKTKKEKLGHKLSSV